MMFNKYYMWGGGQVCLPVGTYVNKIQVGYHTTTEYS